SPMSTISTRSSASTTVSAVSSASNATRSTAHTSISSVVGGPGRRTRFKDITIDLTTEDAIAVKEVWKQTVGLSPSNPTAASSGSPANLFYNQFYENLFAARPDLEFMFPDINRQSAAIGGVFSAALAMLENIDALDQTLDRLGRRHAYVMGIEPEHFEVLEMALFQTLRDRMREKFTPQIELTWSKIFTYMASKMIAAGGYYDD
ncbi:globin-like protein, partial [Dipodascopsis uninucleata]